MVTCTPQLTTALANDPLRVSENLLAKGLISSNLHERLIYTTDTPRDKARRLLASVTACVDGNASHFDSFIAVLKEQGDQTRDIVSILMDTYVRNKIPV